jgi:rhodanese-related sulfurtransferase
MSTSRRLSMSALALGVAAPFAGSPMRSKRAEIDVAAMIAEIERGSDHVDGLELARWIRERKQGLRIIDLRLPAEFAVYAIPTAENVQLAALERARFAANELVVLCSGNGVHAGQAWVFLRAMGVRRVLFLRGGIVEWLDEVMNPVLDAGASAAEKRAFEPTAELSRYFGGTPHVDDAVAASNRPSNQLEREAQAVRQQRRRGC